MIRKRAAILWLLLCLLSALSFAGPDAWGLAEAYKRSLKGQLQFIVAKHPKYTWGGSTDLEKGLDCSGYIFLAAKWAGIPGITRTTAARMADGLGGWASKEVNLHEAEECDLPFWTFDEKRKNGHVGAFLNDRDRRRAVTHAGVHAGVVLEPLVGRLRESLSKVRRLTIGD